MTFRSQSADSRFGLDQRGAQGDALACGQAVGLDGDGRRQRPREADRRLWVGEPSAVGHRYADRLGQSPAEGLAGFQSGCRLRRPEHQRAGRRQPVHHARRQRRLGPNNNEVRRYHVDHALQPVEIADRHGWVNGCHVGHAWVAGRNVDLADAGIAGQPPGKGMLACAAAKDQDAAHSHATTCARTLPARRVMVCVRSGPMLTSVIGTPARSSSASR